MHFDHCEAVYSGTPEGPRFAAGDQFTASQHLSEVV
jgi:hypothetical protein